MKKLLLLAFLATSTLFIACDKNDDGTEEMHTDFDYQAQIQNPTDGDIYTMGDAMTLEVDFESQTNEIVHNISVTISKADGAEVFQMHDHVHETSGKYTLNLDVNLSDTEGYEAHTDYILEAKVWGHDDGIGEVIETVGFHVHPM